ncbi:hypothetical protein CPC08DRAFT_708979 [Agrocybe pediades]|nr:hypothetical protein CPC08DRAFT_708979 [Agrocybe pediades]
MCIYAVLNVDFLSLQEILPAGVPKVIQEIRWVLFASGFPGPRPLGESATSTGNKVQQRVAAGADLARSIQAAGRTQLRSPYFAW